MVWGKQEKENWYKEQLVKRSYQDQVLQKIDALSDHYIVENYGALPIDPKRYPLYTLQNKDFDSQKKTILITGGVHGYETSGVQGALAFLDKLASPSLSHFNKYFNFVCAPCISPWGYETINRWNPNAIDPNRSFHENSPAEECQFFLRAMKKIDYSFLAHFDLHETTDTDNTVFRPALEARDGVPQELWDIPDGFYLVANASSPQSDFQKSIIDSVRKITHIAPADANQRLIGVPIEQEGVINYDIKKLNLCAGFSDAQYTSTTEVYPDSPKANDSICIDAQVAAVSGGLDYLMKQ